MALNVRLPDQVLGDIRAQLAASHVAEDRLLLTLAEYGLTSLNEIAKEIFHVTEGITRQEIPKNPLQEFIQAKWKQTVGKRVL